MPPATMPAGAILYDRLAVVRGRRGRLARLEGPLAWTRINTRLKD